MTAPMKFRLPVAFALWFGMVTAGVLTAGCGGGSSAPVVQTVPSLTPSVTMPIVSGDRFVVSGSKGITFAFAVGAGVPAGETAVVTALPPVPPCTGTGCTAVQPPFDGFQLTVGPQPLAVSALTSVALSGVPSPFNVLLVVQDTSDLAAFTNFRLIPPAGGPLSVADPGSVRPVSTLAPGHTYAIAIYLATVGPS